MVYDQAIYIGRFQPWHNGHLEVLGRALNLARRVRILVGLTKRPDPRNPYSFVERQYMILNSVEEHLHGRTVQIDALHDTRDPVRDDLWISRVRAFAPVGTRTLLVGHKRDSTSEYLSWFPDWDVLDVADRRGITGTDLRMAVNAGNFPYVNSRVPPSTTEILYNHHEDAS